MKMPTQSILVAAALLASGALAPVPAAARPGWQAGGYVQGGSYHGAAYRGGYYRGGWGHRGYWGPGLFWGGLGLGLGIGAVGYYGAYPAYYPTYYGGYYDVPGEIVVAPSASRAIVIDAPAGERTVRSGQAVPQARPAEPIFYPKNAQSDAVLENDRRECNRWATTQAGAMADASIFQRATFACMEGRGYTVR